MKLNGWYRIGIVLTALWFLVSSFIYIQGINNYPSKYTNIVSHNHYEWVTDIQAIKDAESNKRPSTPDGFELIKPTFKTFGYLAFVFLPAGVTWIIILLAIFIVRWVYAGFKT